MFKQSKKILSLFLIVLVFCASSLVMAGDKEYATLSGEDVLEMSIELTDQIESLGVFLPEEVVIPFTDNITVKLEDTLYLMAKWLQLYLEAGEEIPDEVPYLHFEIPEELNANGALDGQIDLANYEQMTSEICSILEESAPVIPSDFMLEVTRETVTTTDPVTPDVAIYIISRVIRFTAYNGRLPNFAAVRVVIPPDDWPEL